MNELDLFLDFLSFYKENEDNLNIKLVNIIQDVRIDYETNLKRRGDNDYPRDYWFIFKDLHSEYHLQNSVGFVYNIKPQNLYYCLKFRAYRDEIYRVDFRIIPYNSNMEPVGLMLPNTYVMEGKVCVDNVYCTPMIVHGSFIKTMNVKSFLTEIDACMQALWNGRANSDLDGLPISYRYELNNKLRELTGQASYISSKREFLAKYSENDHYNDLLPVLKVKMIGGKNFVDWANHPQSANTASITKKVRSWRRQLLTV